MEESHIPILKRVEGTTLKLQKLTGENDRLNVQYPVNNTESRFGVLGADLGTPVEHDGKLYFLFGDTILGKKDNIRNHPDDIVREPLPLPHFLGDDSIGWTTAIDPEQKVSLEFVSRADLRDGMKTYIPPEIHKDGRPLLAPLGYLQVPTGGFSSNGKLYVIYTLKNNDLEPSLRTQDGMNHNFNEIFLAIKKDNLSVIGKYPALVKEADVNWNPIRNGREFNIFNWEIMWKSFLVSTDCLDGPPCINNSTIKFNFIFELSNIYNKVKNSLTYAIGTGIGTESGRKYLILDLDQFSDINSLGKFIHVSCLLADNLNIQDLPTPSTPYLLVWGIGLFRRSNVFLACISIESLARNEKNIMYYAGKKEGSGDVVWSVREEDAVPLFDHPVIGEFNVSWNPFLGVWIMVYNNDTDSALIDRPTFIQFRAASAPWGPWSEPEILFNPENGADDEQCNIIYYNFNEGWKSSCIQKTDFADAQAKIGSDGREDHRGLGGSPYGPFVIPRFTKKIGKNNSIVYFVMSTWYPYNTVLMKSELTKNEASNRIVYRCNPVFIQSNFGRKGNFELVVPFRIENTNDTNKNPVCDGGLVHFFRNNDNPDLPWSNFTPVKPFPEVSDSSASSDDFVFPQFDNVTFIQSKFGSENFQQAANFEVVGRVGNRLKHVWRESKYPFFWRNTSTFLKINYSRELSGVTGNPSLIQSKFGTRKMNFELVVPLEGGGIYHIYKINDGSDPGNSPWQIGNGGVPLDPTRTYEAVSLIQSNYGIPENPGNFELVARTTEGRLIFFWMNSINHTQWNGPFPLSIEGKEIKDMAGIPSLIQSTFGSRGNFELVTPHVNGGFMHYFRDNDSSGTEAPRWYIGNNGRPVNSKRKYEGLSLYQTNFMSGTNNHGNLEVIALSSDGTLEHYWMDSGTKTWDGPYKLGSF